MIIEDNNEKIDSFSEYLTKKLSSIDNLSCEDQTLFKKILYVSFLDSLSACIYPDRKNRERFISLIDRFSQWEHRNHVCMLHINKLASMTSDPDLEKIRVFAQSELKKWLEIKDMSGVIRIEQTPTIDEISDKWKKNGGETGLKYSLSDFKHSSLLYQLRNSLVHQFQSKGTELGTYLPDEPFYQVVVSFDEDMALKPINIELVYPVEFLNNLSHKTLENVIKYFRDGNMNPFPHYYSGDFWIDAFNR